MSANLGKKVQEILNKRGMSKSEFARRISRQNATVHDILSRESMDTELLATISQVLEYNFFVYLAYNSNLMFDERGTNDYGSQLNAYPVYLDKRDVELERKYYSLLEKYSEVLEENKQLTNPLNRLNEPSIQFTKP